MAIKSNIKALMEEKGKTVRGLAEETDISDKTIMRSRGPLIEACSLKTLEVIAQALGVRVKDLFEEGEQGGQPPGKES
jgi:DNA-binding Xre family transcriptional regulator